jgi:predicted DNA-binding transcriptional regulator AlpA
MKTQAPAPHPLWHSLPKSSKMLGVSVPTIYRGAKAGKIKLTKICGRTGLSDAEVNRLANDGTEAL